MSSTHHIESRPVPTLAGAAVFRAKSFLLQIKRLLKDATDNSLLKFVETDELKDVPVVGESRTRLWTETDDTERALVAGKIQNLRLAVAELNGTVVPAETIFSFWRNVGRTTRRRGFVAGRELREGCIIPNVGGGLCQLSNALYDTALKANFDIIERHAHTQVIAGSLAEHGRDATVFWNYVDLRFRSPAAFRIEAELSRDHLTVRFRGTSVTKGQLHALTRARPVEHSLNSCASCGIDDCFRAMKPSAESDFGKTAFLVDEHVPEFDTYIQTSKNGHDELLMPIDGHRFRKGNYAWTTTGFARVKQQPYLTAIRSFRSRQLAVQGAARQRNLLAMSERLADAYAKSLRFDALHLVVQQEMLPFLWRSGVLGGRTFDVMMSSLPMSEIQNRLDSAHKLHPESRTLGDFRADDTLLEAEAEALKAARKIITPHSAIAEIFSDKAEHLSWKIPDVPLFEKKKNERPVIVFPASTVGRKGCYELREAIRDMEVKLVTLGPYIEDVNFWDDIDAECGGDDWLMRADAVVLPAFVEHRPRRLLRAAAAKIPVIATSACGVDNVDGVTVVPEGDVISLKHAIENALFGPK